MLHNLVVVACSKNESPFMKEWIEYHHMIGVDHFYIYDTGEGEEVLKPYVERGLVTYILWTHSPAQVYAYQNFVFARRGAEASWAAFIDLDEYILPMRDERLADALVEYDKPHIAGLAIGWSIFGANGHITRPEGLIMENYTKCVDYTLHPERFTKCIVRPFRISYIDDPHIFRPKSRSVVVREDYKPIKFGEHHHKVGDFPVSRFRINHYFCKCYNDFLGKIKRGGPDGGGRYLEEFANCNKAANAVEDLSIQKFVPELRRRIYG